MNFSTTADKINTTEQSLSYEELFESYMQLKNQHESLTKQHEASQQELHDIKRTHQFSEELKQHLTSEVEALQKSETQLKIEYSNKIQSLQDVIEELKEEKWREIEIYKNKIDTLENQVSKLKDNDLKENIPMNSVAILDNSKTTDELRQYEEEIDHLKVLILEQKKELGECLNLNEMRKDEIEALKEQNECLKSNLDAKKEEVAKITDMLHSAQEDICTTNAELQQFKNQNNAHAAKGNSLFAEVDDKRQEMLKSLSQMKEKVYQLNHELVSKQAEIDSLLCEKKALWEQYSGQASHHDAVLNKAYERRITDLEKQTDQLQREIARWFDKYLDPKSSESAQWLSGIMEYYREENHRLSCELSACSVDNLCKEQHLRELQRQMVAWRTKAMESNAAVSQLETKIQLTEQKYKLPTVKAENNVSLVDRSIIASAKNEDFVPTARKIDMSSIKLSPNSINNVNSIIKVRNDNSSVKVVKKTTFQ